MTADGYDAVYDAGETSESVVDLIVTILAGLVSFGTLIALVFLYKWFKKNAPMKL